jgi:hypothetical protein
LTFTSLGLVLLSTTGNDENRNDPDLVQAFLKKWWVESDFKAQNLPLSLRLKGSGCHYNSIERMCGTGSVMACVPKNGVAYEVVLSERRLVRELTENLNIKGQSYHVKELLELSVLSWKISSYLYFPAMVRYGLISINFYTVLCL